MNQILEQIYKIEDLSELEILLRAQDTNLIRDRLLAEFDRYAFYKNVSEWNKAVKICECLAIIGWGERESLEALRGKFYNGYAMTYFLNAHGEARYVEATWSKRKTGLSMQDGDTIFHPSPDASGKTLARPVKEDIQDVKLNSQRNWIAKNPVRITRAISNCYESSRAVIESLFLDLQPALNAKMRPQIYGSAINYIKLRCAFSFSDRGCKTNYIIAPDKPKLSSQRAWELIHEMMGEDERRAGGYYLRNRFEYSPFRKDTGKTGALIHFEREFSELAPMEQKRRMGEYFLTALKQIAQKQSKLEYDFAAMIEDFSKILDEWLKAKI
ncbi:hypothetical protein [uncultured Campylobacter sp.]|uniref:hypothetical protein n=1 Tax=uncultured Campylobacter sp. TaxID=218934 RepID=UPI00260E9508|nr:hypothetical protein [uncultured Campylobacter sp.]